MRSYKDSLARAERFSLRTSKLAGVGLVSALVGLTTLGVSADEVVETNNSVEITEIAETPSEPVVDTPQVEAVVSDVEVFVVPETTPEVETVEATESFNDVALVSDNQPQEEAPSTVVEYTPVSFDSLVAEIPQVEETTEPVQTFSMLRAATPDGKEVLKEVLDSERDKGVGATQNGVTVTSTTTDTEVTRDKVAGTSTVSITSNQKLTDVYIVPEIYIDSTDERLNIGSGNYTKLPQADYYISQSTGIENTPVGGGVNRTNGNHPVAHFDDIPVGTNISLTLDYSSEVANLITDSKYLDTGIPYKVVWSVYDGSGTLLGRSISSQVYEFVKPETPTVTSNKRTLTVIQEDASTVNKVAGKEVADFLIKDNDTAIRVVSIPEDGSSLPHARLQGDTISATNTSSSSTSFTFSNVKVAYIVDPETAKYYDIPGNLGDAPKDFIPIAEESIFQLTSTGNFLITAPTLKEQYRDEDVSKLPDFKVTPLVYVSGRDGWYLSSVGEEATIPVGNTKYTFNKAPQTVGLLGTTVAIELGSKSSPDAKGDLESNVVYTGATNDKALTGENNNTGLSYDNMVENTDDIYARVVGTYHLTDLEGKSANGNKDYEGLKGSLTFNYLQNVKGKLETVKITAYKYDELHDRANDSYPAHSIELDPTVNQSSLIESVTYRTRVDGVYQTTTVSYDEFIKNLPDDVVDISFKISDLGKLKDNGLAVDLVFALDPEYAGTLPGEFDSYYIPTALTDNEANARWTQYTSYVLSLGKDVRVGVEASIDGGINAHDNITFTSGRVSKTDTERLTKAVAIQSEEVLLTHEDTRSVSVGQTLSMKTRVSKEQLSGKNITNTLPSSLENIDFSVNLPTAFMDLLIEKGEIGADSNITTELTNSEIKELFDGYKAVTMTGEQASTNFFAKLKTDLNDLLPVLNAAFNGEEGLVFNPDNNQLTIKGYSVVSATKEALDSVETESIKFTTRGRDEADLDKDGLTEGDVNDGKNAFVLDAQPLTYTITVPKIITGNTYTSDNAEDNFTKKTEGIDPRNPGYSKVNMVNLTDVAYYDSVLYAPIPWVGDDKGTEFDVTLTGISGTKPTDTVRYSTDPVGTPYSERTFVDKVDDITKVTAVTVTPKDGITPGYSAVEVVLEYDLPDNGVSGSHYTQYGEYYAKGSTGEDFQLDILPSELYIVRSKGDVVARFFSVDADGKVIESISDQVAVTPEGAEDSDPYDAITVRPTRIEHGGKVYQLVSVAQSNPHTPTDGELSVGGYTDDDTFVGGKETGDTVAGDKTKVVNFYYEEVVEETTTEEVVGSVVISYVDVDGNSIQPEAIDVEPTVLKTITRTTTRTISGGKVQDVDGVVIEDVVVEVDNPVTYDTTEEGEKPDTIEFDGQTYFLVKTGVN